MQIAEILSADRVASDVASRSKKAALEVLAGLISRAEPGLSSTEVFDSLVARERLGSTGLGHGVALPHGRRKHGDTTVGAFVKLQRGIDFDAIDRQPVDLLFALIVPEESTNEHLQILSRLAERFSDPSFLEKLRRSPSREKIFNLLTG